MNERPEVAEQIAAAQDLMVEQLGATRGSRRARFVAAARRPTSRPRRVWMPLSVAGVAAFAVVALVWMWPDTEQPSSADPPRIAAGSELESSPEAPPSEASVVALAGGGRLETAADAVATVRSVGADQTAVVLESGAVRVDARGRTRHAVSVEAGPFRVTSTDSQALVRWDASIHALEVKVTEGTVEVLSVELGVQQTVVAGDAVVFPTLEVTSGQRVQTPAAVPEELSPKKAVTSPTRRPADWRDLAARGDHKQAVAAAVATGFAAVVAKASADELLALARAARYAKDAKRSRQALKGIRKRFAKSGSAARAAYALGRVAFDFERDYGEAAKWFSTYLAEAPAGALTREALGRLVESQHRSGAAAAARKSGKRYLDRYPDGPHADIARKAQ